MNNTTTKAPRCEECGNDGSLGALYLTVDCRWRPTGARSGAWELVERQDTGGGGFDCLNCDHQTEAHGEAASFPYGAMISPPGTVQPVGRDLVAMMLAALQRAGRVLDMSNPDDSAFVDSGADCIQALCEAEDDIRTAIAAAGKPAEPSDDATVLAALRMWQAAGEAERAPFLDIATNAGLHKPLGAAGVDRLCAKHGGAA